MVTGAEIIVIFNFTYAVRKIFSGVLLHVYV